VEGGDGSTLSLDFTTGVLDPRLTFTRSTNATFINSQGLVEWANHNLWYNTAFSGLTGTNPTLPASGWNYAGTTGSGKDIVFNGDGSVTTKTPSGTLRCGLQRTTSITNTTLLLAVSLDVVADANATYGTLTASDLVSEGSATDIAFYINGGSVPASTVITGPCNLTWVFQKTGGGTVTPFFGANIRGAKSGAFTIRFANPRFGLWGGVAPFPYFANTSTTAERHDPRFDYDPSTLQPRGLLIEGSASNYGTYSESFATSGPGVLWTYSDITKNAILASSPAGNNDAAQFNETTVNTIHRISQFITAASGAVTISVWAKAIDPTTPRRLYVNAIGLIGCGALFDLDPAVQTGASGTAVNVAGTAPNRAGTWVKYPNGWYRCSIVGTYVAAATIYLQVNRASSTVATDDTYSGSTANGLMLYGFQTELGSGASSYIPTGASTGSRAADSCYLTDFAGWSAGGNFSTTEGTLFVDQAVTFVGTANYPIGGFSTSNTAGSRFGWQYRQGDSPQGYRGLVNAGYVYELPIGAGWSIPAGTTRFRHAMSCGGGTSAFLRQSFKSSAATGAPTQNNYSDTSTLNISGVAAFTLTQSIFTASVRIARVKYWPRAFTLAELDALTN
jgi:hypothetical protein